jgi:replicative DNA helicase
MGENPEGTLVLRNTGGSVMTCDIQMQTRLLCALAADPEFLKQNVAKLRLDDFPAVAARIIFETMRLHLFRYDAHPTATVFPEEVLNALRGIGPDGANSIATEIPESMVKSVASCLGKVMVALSNPSNADTAYFKDRLREYLMTVRLSAMPGHEMNAVEQLEAAAKIKAEVEQITGGEHRGLSKTARTRVVKRKTTMPKKFGTGVWPIDIRMKMGMELGEIGCVLGASGSGKTNMLVNFAANAALRGQHSLFLTLEVSDEIILRRLHAMMGNFNMSTMDKAEEDWPEQDLARYDYMLSERFPNIDYVTVNYEYVDKTPTCEDIDREIGIWREDMRKAGIPDDVAPIVCIDYIRQIDSGRLAGRNDNTNTKYGAIMQSLKRLAIKHNCVIWTAQQVTRSANHKEHIRKDDIADSIAIVNHCDVILGFVPRINQEQKAAVTHETEEDTVENHSDKERLMNVDFVKLRNAGETGSFCTVFQGKSLKLWTSEQYARVMENMASNAKTLEDFDKFFANLKPKA